MLDHNAARLEPFSADQEVTDAPGQQRFPGPGHTLQARGHGFEPSCACQAIADMSALIDPSKAHLASSVRWRIGSLLCQRCWEPLSVRARHY